MELSSQQLRSRQVTSIVGSHDVGVSFSLLACSEYGLDWREAFEALLKMGFRRFRLMSYWSLHEPVQGQMSFNELDEQIAMIARYKGHVTLSIGMRQPRWPETHLPTWTNDIDHTETKQRYLSFHEAVIMRYRDSQTVVSWQLENEFWLKSFGKSFDFSRRRLKEEFEMIRRLNPSKPIIMSLSSFGSLPLFKPTPDLFATSMYRVIYDPIKGYTHTKITPKQYAIKRALLRFIKKRDLIIHELQAEPWGPKANWEMSVEEQDASMNEQEIRHAVDYARSSGIAYMDLWGAEWWYWRSVRFKDDRLIETVRKFLEG